MKSTWIVLPVALGIAAAAADEPARLSKEDLAAKLNGVEPEDITESPIEGLLQVSVDSSVAYVTADGRFLLEGELYDLDSLENLTESTRAGVRVDLLEGVDPSEMIVFAPEGEARHTVTIFTDIDCGYCRQFHREIDKVNALGIEVHYLAFPRTGPDSESWDKAQKVWCAEDRNTALTRAKLGGAVPEDDCGEAPVAEHYDLGQRVGVRGTPAMFAENGELLGGYLPPESLAQRLEEIASSE